ISKFGGDPTKSHCFCLGAGSVLQQVIAHGGQTKPKLLRGAITSSSWLPSQHQFDDPVPE
ncbi:hypothetical protein B0H13DRAFT_1484529, partial [Mycena leptocephala]